MSDTLVKFIGTWTFICFASIGLIAVQSILLYCIAQLGKSIYQRLTRTYALHVVWYWLERLEKEGSHCFEKAVKEQGQ